MGSPYGIIYILEHKESHKRYVGQTTRPLTTRVSQHIYCSKISKGNHKLYNAISKYGIESFWAYKIDEGYSKESLDSKEIFWITTLKTTTSLGYNVRGGGSRGKLSEEQKKEISRVHKGKKVSSETRQKISQSLSGRKGHPVSEQTRISLKEKNKGHEPWNKGKGKKEKTCIKSKYSHVGAENGKSKKVKCIETGQIFNSLTEAGEVFNLLPPYISLVCRDKRDSYGGFHWCFIKPTGEE